MRLWHNAIVETSALIIFLLITFFGSYIQAVAGFAMGMLIVAVAGGLRLIELETLAAVVSMIQQVVQPVCEPTKRRREMPQPLAHLLVLR